MTGFWEIARGHSLAFLRGDKERAPMRLRISILGAVVALVVACDRSPGALADHAAPLTPSAVSPAGNGTSSGSSVAAAALQRRPDVLVNMQGACDPDTVHAALGP